MGQDPLHPCQQRRDRRRPGGRYDAHVDEVRAGGDAGVGTTRCGAVAGHETGYMGAVPARIGGRDEARSTPAAREIDRRNDPADKVGVRRDAAVEDRDADAASSDAELPPGVGRSDLQDPRAVREGGAGDRVERREHEVV